MTIEHEPGAIPSGNQSFNQGPSPFRKTLVEIGIPGRHAWMQQQLVDTRRRRLHRLVVGEHRRHRNQSECSGTPEHLEFPAMVHPGTVQGAAELALSQPRGGKIDDAGDAPGGEFAEQGVPAEQRIGRQDRRVHRNGYRLGEQVEQRLVDAADRQDADEVGKFR